jgi:thymidylate synthase
MKQYLDMLNYVLYNGVASDDRTGVGTIRVFGYQNRYDLNNFPIVTTKKVPFRLVVSELLWFISGSTNNFDLLKNNNHIWDEWATKEQCAKFGREEGDLGPIYGKQWTCFGEWSKNINLVKPKTPSEKSMTSFNYDKTKENKYIVLDNNVGNDSSGRPLCKIKFEASNHEMIVRRDRLKVNNVKDPYKPTYQGIGYIGEYVEESDVKRNLIKTWSHMIDRCYNKNCKEFLYYGEKGITVCPRWHSFRNFYEDSKRLIGWYFKKNNPHEYELDKDHFSGKIYSPETCCWIHQSLNKSYRDMIPFEAKDPDGNIYYHFSVPDFSKMFNLNQNCICRCLRGERPNHNKWTFRKVEDRYIRYQSPINQIEWLINEIKTNPNSRRLIITGWNPLEQNMVSLPPCHTLFQFSVINNTLSCQLYQRSADAGLGVPFNISSYALLTHMIAHVCGLQVGEFIHSFGDLHIYKNHIDQIKTQLQRTPKTLPKLVLNRVARNSGFEGLLDFKIEDIILENYDPYPTIKMDVAV